MKARTRKINRALRGGFWVALLIGLSFVGYPRSVFGEDGDAHARWNRMSGEEKQRLRENYARWKGMPLEERETLKTNYGRFRQLNDGDRARVMERYKTFRSMTPEKQERLRKRLQKFMRLSPQERSMRIQKVRERRGGSEGGAKLRRIPNRVTPQRDGNFRRPQRIRRR